MKSKAKARLAVLGVHSGCVTAADPRFLIPMGDWCRSFKGGASSELNLRVHWSHE